MDHPLHSISWQNLRKPLEENLAAFLALQRWFGGKTRTITRIAVVDFIPVPLDGLNAAVVLVRVSYEDGGSETYAVPLLAHSSSPKVAADARTTPSLKISAPGGEEFVFSDALWNRDFLLRVFDSLSAAGTFLGLTGQIACVPTPVLETLRRAAPGPLEPSVMKAEQSNTSVLFGRSFVLKLFRHVEEGVNPDFEVGEFLSVRAGFHHVPPAAGVLEYRRPGAPPATIGILQGFVANRGDAWQQTLAALGRFYDRVPADAPAPPRGLDLLAGARSPLPAQAADLLGEYRDSANLLGRRTAELHLALASNPNDPDFAPEPFSLAEQREISNGMIRLGREALAMLGRRAGELPPPLRERAAVVLGAESKLLTRFRRLAEHPLSSLRTRIHGDLHLGQILATGEDFIFIDFEGEPARTLAERRAKHSPVRDVAGMLRSFHYAAFAALFARAGEAGVAAPVFTPLSPFANAWYRWVSAEFLRAYLETAAGSPFLPGRGEELDFLLDLWLLEKAVYELKYELNHRLGWVAIPLEGICGLIEDAG